MEDIDVPKLIRSDGMWDHPATDAEFREWELPNGVHGVNSSGGEVYEGPCPPDRMHRYFFRLYARSTLNST